MSKEHLRHLEHAGKKAGENLQLLTSKLGASVEAEIFSGKLDKLKGLSNKKMGLMNKQEIALYSLIRPEKLKGTNYSLPVPAYKHVVDAAYHGDSGFDIAAKEGTPVFSMGSGTIVYSEYGHTPWGRDVNKGIDTPYSVLVKLDKPLTKKGKVVKAVNGEPVRYIWYTHLSKIRFNQKEGAGARRIKDGELLGLTGSGNKNPHLHLGLISRPSQKHGSISKMETIRAFFNTKEGSPITGI